MTNHQCYCYGIIAIHNLLKEKFPLTSNEFYDELYYLWYIYSEEAIEKEYAKMEENGKFNKLNDLYIRDWN